MHLFNLRYVMLCSEISCLRPKWRVGKLLKSQFPRQSLLNRSISISAARDGKFLTLERCLGNSFENDKGLQATGAFSAEFFPDLPLGTTWEKLFEAYTRIARDTLKRQAPKDDFRKPYTTAKDSKKVMAVAAQLRNEDELRRRMIQLTSSEGGAQPADVFLCVSGTHPFRTLPLVSRNLLSSVDLLKMAQQLKRNKLIPARTETWVVANPNVEADASLLERKVENGATAVVTQPPLNRRNFERWLSDADKRGLLLLSGIDSNNNSSSSGAGAGSSSSPSGVPLIVGLSLITSSRNFAFWLALCHCAGARDCRDQLTGLREMEAAERNAAARGGTGRRQADVDVERELDRRLYERFYEFNVELAQWIQSLGPTRGLHVMPLTRQARAMATQMIGEGQLPGSGRPRSA